MTCRLTTGSSVPILGAVAKESDDKSRRLRRKHQELAEAGKVSGGGTRPFGFEADRVTIRPDEAAITMAETGCWRVVRRRRSVGTSKPEGSRRPWAIRGRSAFRAR